MSILYIDKSDCVIGKQDNRITVKYKDGMVRTIPVESIDGITLLGHAQVTTQCIQECLKKGISLSYFSSSHLLYVSFIAFSPNIIIINYSIILLFLAREYKGGFYAETSTISRK